MNNLLFTRPEPAEKAADLAVKYFALSRNLEEISYIIETAYQGLKREQGPSAVTEKISAFCDSLKSFLNHCQKHGEALLYMAEVEDRREFERKVKEKESVLSTLWPDLSDGDPIATLRNGSVLLQTVGAKAISWFRTPEVVEIILLEQGLELMRIVYDLSKSPI